MKDTYSSGKTVKIRFLDPKDRMEVIREFERLAHESMGGRTEFIQNWCAKNGLNYKTYEKWRLDDQGKNSINKNYNVFNSSTWDLKVKTGDIVFFPGELTHESIIHESDNDRIMIGSSYFIKGKIGFDNKANAINISDANE